MFNGKGSGSLDPRFLRIKQYFGGSAKKMFTLIIEAQTLPQNPPTLKSKLLEVNLEGLETSLFSFSDYRIFMPNKIYSPRNIA